MTSLKAWANKTILSPDGNYQIKYKNGDTQDIIKVILYADKHNKGDLIEFSKRIPGINLEQKLKTLWSFIRSEIRYKADKKGLEEIKTPSQVWWKYKSADCKSMSLFVAMVLKSWKVPYKYRFVSWPGSNNISHVYVIAMPPGQKEIIVDTVYHLFNKEAKYNYKTDYKMTQVAYISGLKNNTRQSRVDIQFPQEIATPAELDWTGSSEGEFNLNLLDEQLRIVSNYYGDPKGIWQLGRNMIHHALKGLHTNAGVASFTYAIPKELQHIAAGIKRGKKKHQHSSKFLTNINSINGPSDFIINDDCYSSYFVRKTPDPINDDEYYYTPHPGKEAEFKECLARKRYVPMLNRSLEKSSHHLLYNFIAKPNRESNIVAIKANSHKSSIEIMHNITGISIANLNLWTYNGVMRNNVREGTEPWNPEQTISILRQGAKLTGRANLANPKGTKDSNIGEPVSATIITLKIISEIIAGLIVALGTTATLIAVLKKDPKKDLLNNANDWGNRSNSADTDDFDSNGDGNGNDLSSNLIPMGLLGLGAVALLNDK